MGAALAEAPPIPDDDRPTIVLGTELHEIVDAAIDALAADPTLYQRDGVLVHVTRAPGGGPVIRAIGPANMRERLTGAAKWERIERKKRGNEIVTESVRCLPPDTVVHACLHPGRAGDRVRPLIGILESPSLRPDGTAIDAPGYDMATGYLYAPSMVFPPIPRKLSRDLAARALAALSAVFAEFPFRGDADRMAVVAAIGTLMARPAIAGAVPATIIDASTPGSGKTLIVDVVAIIATGRGAPRMTFTEDVDETSKNLGACALQGERLIAFDNIAVPFGGGPIDMVLTAEDMVKLRILGRSESPDMRWRGVIMGTANNLTYRGDTHRRTLAPRLEPTVENPEERTGFEHADLRAWVREHRGALVCAWMTLLRSFIEAGRPRGPVKLWGSFEAWSALIPAAIVWAGGADPMGCRPAADDDSRDEERAGVSAILDAIARIAPEGGITTRGLVDVLFTNERLRGEDKQPDGHDDARDAIETFAKTPPGRKPDASKLSYVLRKWRRRVVGDRRLEAAQNRNGVAKWFVANRAKDEKGTAT